MTHSILGSATSHRRSVRQPSRQRRAVAASLVAGVVGTTGLAMAPANAVATGTTFHALEIFASEGAPDVTADCGGTVTFGTAGLPAMAKPADLPSGTTASVVVIGPYNGSTTVSTKKGDCTVYTVGTLQIAGLAGHRVAKGLPTPKANNLVKVIAVAAVTDTGTTKLIAEKVVNRKRQARGATEVEVAYVADVTAVTKTGNPWTVKDKAGVDLKLDVTAAEIDDGLGADVTAQFLTAPAPPD